MADVLQAGTFRPNSETVYILFPLGEFFKTVQALPTEAIPNALGLPQSSVAASYDVFAITPKRGFQPTVYQSVIAPTQQGIIQQSGGVVQSIIPNRQMFTDAQYVTSLGRH